MSYSPQTGLVYIPVLNMAFGWVADPDYVERQGWWNQGIILPPLPDDASQRAAILASAQGSLVAWNPSYNFV